MPSQLVQTTKGAVVPQIAPMDPKEIIEAQWEGVHGTTGWDVGANAGQSLPLMLDRFQRVISFEPAWESWQMLQANYAGDPRVILKRLAVSDADGKVELAVRQAPIMSGQLVSPGMPYRGEHMDEQGTANWGGDVTTRMVRCATLDTLVTEYGRPDFVKIDTEGHELKILQGGPKLLAGKATQWLIEFHDEPLHDECVRLLEASGHVVETLRHPHYPEESYMWYRHGWLRAEPA